MSKRAQDKISLSEYDQEMATTFKGDCEEFLKEFEALNSLSYDDFAKIWKARSFTYVFAGQKYALLLKELCENYFCVVKKFIMFPRSIYTQVGALYLLYGLYYKQPLKNWVKIRLTLEEYKEVMKLITELKLREEYDAVYIFAKMKTEQAFIYTAQRKPLGPEDRFVKSYQLYYDDTFRSTKTESSLDKFNDLLTSSDLVADLEKTNSEYQEKFKEYAEKDCSLTQFASSIVEDLRQAYQEVQEGMSNFGDNCLTEGTVQNLKRSIRDKAFSNQNAVYRGRRKVKTAQDQDMVVLELDPDT